MATSAAEVTAFYEKETNTLQYVLADPIHKQCAIIDSVWDYILTAGKFNSDSADALLKFVESKGYTVTWILETHCHADHISAGNYLQKKTGAPVAIGEHIKDVQETFKKLYNFKDMKTDGSQFDRLFKDGDEFKVGQLSVKVMHTPGHTPACVCYYVPDQCVFVGDTVFMPDGGTARCDFPNGSPAQLFDSVSRLFTLPPHVRVYVCHDYQPGGREMQYASTIQDEATKNTHLQISTLRDEFVSQRSNRDVTLSAPRLILPAVQINMNAGKLPVPEDNGITYLKIPINLFNK